MTDLDTIQGDIGDLDRRLTTVETQLADVRRTLDEWTSTLGEAVVLARETNEQIERLVTQQSRLAEARLEAVQMVCGAITSPSRGFLLLVALVALGLGAVSVGDLGGLWELASEMVWGE